ncbi:hypothetical protein [Tautonia sociabilis]|uniref:Lipoprotein n=1 Tax=Tautonia sociabilis TaxID=2080755 RepID=A0A432MFY9_9BACT|nr:hypothetical protein [Tautonia sociabilis]RUL85374.1 hypothetical protein TsocGM_18535 [Tautonia sociabilis]
MRFMKTVRVLFLFPVAAAAGLLVGCGSGNPKIAEAPPYEPPPTTPAPPKMKGPDGTSYEYGSNPDYQEAMEKMNASQGLGR